MKPKVADTIRTAVLCLGALTVSFGLAELATRLVLPDPREMPVPFEPGNYVEGLFVAHPTRGYAYAPDFTGRQILDGNFDTEIRTNELGLRDREIDLYRDKRPRILALGNSFTAGEGVAQHEAWPAQLEKTLHSRGFDVVSINAGVPGYGLQQMRATAKEMIPLIKPELIVLGLFVQGYDRVGDPYVLVHGEPVRRSKARYLERRGDIYYYDVPYTRFFWLDKIISKSHLLIYLKTKIYDGIRPWLESRSVEPGLLPKMLSPMLEEVRRMAEMTESHDIPLAVLLINRQDRFVGFNGQQKINEIISKFGDELGVLVVDPLPALKKVSEGRPVLRFPDDGHWTPLGHEVAAVELARVVPRLLDLGGAPKE